MYPELTKCSYLECSVHQKICGSVCYSGPKVRMLTKPYHSVIAQNYHAFTGTSLWVKSLAQLIEHRFLNWLKGPWFVSSCGHSSYSSTWAIEFCNSNKMSKKNHYLFSKVCCDGVIHNSRPEFECCGRFYVYKPSPDAVCCGGQFYSPVSNYTCCGKRYQKLMSNHTRLLILYNVVANKLRTVL